MNRIYKLKFDKRRNELVIVSEITAGAGKEKSTGHLADLTALSPFRKLLGTLTPVALLTGLIAGLLPAMALAADLPTGGQIVGGQGSISTSGNQMTIHQQTQNMATNWHSFDIGKNNTVQFVQPNSSSVALNRVTGASGSQIMGTLKANGQVFILNPNGVLFGKNARVDVGGLVASTKNISTTDFMKGQYTLSGSGNPGAQVVNQGSLTTSKGGYIVLAGERVSNSGTVTTPSGKTILAAGKTVTLQLDNGGLTSVSVNGSVVNALVENQGLISATNGQVYLTAKGQDMLLNTVVNNSGTVEAKGLANRGGEIVLNGGDSGVVSQSGHLLADSQTGQGGKITLEGQNIHLAGGSLTTATGKTGGGEVYVGGGWQGQDSHIKNASKVVMDKTATVDVSATENGNGGTAVLWSDDYTNFRGTVLAKGGAKSGDGGRVETSSHRNLQASGAVDASARAGHGGEWLLDPTDVTIVGAGADTGIDSATADGTDIFTPTASGGQILNSSIVNQLNAGTSVTVKTSGTDTDGETGNITVNANIIKTAGTDAKLTLLADNNISTGDNVSIGATTGKLNLDLLAGNTTNNASISLGKFINISLNGGDLLADAGNSASGVSLTFMNNGKIKGGNVTLNLSRGLGGYAYNVNADNDLTINGSVTGSTGWGAVLGFTAGGKLAMNSPGSISLQANDPGNGGGRVLISGDKGVTLNAAAGTVTLNAAKAATNGVNITSGNGAVSITNMVQDGSNGMTLTNANISSKDGIVLNGTTFWGQAVVMSGVNLTTGGDVDITGLAKNLTTGGLGAASSSGVQLSGSNISSTGGNITLTGTAGTDISHPSISSLQVSNSTLTTNNALTLNGTTETTTGVKVTGSTLSAATLNVNGVAHVQGTGFSLATSQLLGGLADLTNVSLSSAGSAAGAQNVLDNSIVNDANRDTLLAKRIENMTSVEMNGTAIFDDSAKSDKGWTHDYSSVDTPNGGWIFNNTSVTAGGDVNLKGVAFTNATVTVSNGSLTLDNGGAVPLTGTTVTVNDGAVSVHSGGGNIDLTKGNISAKRDITLKTDNGTVLISGTNATVKANITSSDGDIMITGNSGNSMGVRLVNANLTSINMSINGSAIGGSNDDMASFGAVSLFGADEFHVANTGHGEMNGYVNNYLDLTRNGAIVIGQIFAGGDTNVVFDGSFDIKGDAFTTGAKPSSTYDIFFNNGSSSITFKGGKSSMTSCSHGVYTRFSAYSATHTTNFILDGADFVFNVTAGTAPHQGLSMLGTIEFNKYTSGFAFSGNGNAQLNIHTSSQEEGIYLNRLTNKDLLGNFSLNVTNDIGDAIVMLGHTAVNLVNATITGTSGTGAGFRLESTDKSNVSLGNNTITGISKTGSGIKLIGNNITLSNGTLNGTSGNGSGVVLTGGSNYTLDGASVTGTAADGSGIAVNGTLTVNNGTVVKGLATGGGSGVTVSGDLVTDSGDGISITGTAFSGDGVKVDGDTTLTNAMLNGRADSGNGVNIAGNLTTDSSTQVSGHAASGTGVNLGAALTGASVKGSSDTGTGVQLADNAVVTEAVLNGTSASGDGVTFTGNVKMDDTSAAKLNASSTSGTGLKLADNANVSIQTITKVTQEKKDADGNPVLDADGNPETETITTQAPVTTPVTLTGTSEQGSGIATEGNVSISGIVLNGSTTADTGTGVSLGGNLTIADDISGVTAGATGNGTALVVNNASIHSDGYTDSGKDFVINASVSGNGTAIKTQGSSQLDEVVLNGNATGGGTAVELGGQVSGANITGTSDSGTAVRVTDGAGVDGSAVKGHSDSGTGLQVSGNASLNNSDLSGTTQTGTGAAVTGSLTADTSSQVTGSATQDGGTGVTVDGSVTGATVTGDATSGDAVRIADGSQLTGADIKGTSVTGSGIKTQGNVSLEGGTQLAGGSQQGAALDVSGTLNHDPDSSVTTTPDNTGSVIGNENIHEVIPVVPPMPDEGGNNQPDQKPGGDTDKPTVPSEPDQKPGGDTDKPTVPSEPDHNQEHDHNQSHNASLRKQAEVNSLRQGAANAQVTQMNRASQDGFHAAGSPPVPVSGYQPAEQTVDISLCDDSDCQSESLDAGRPAQGRAKTSGR
ncbi:filamentous hemagglutinin N-terminal domain-containing protein [Salmonella enterica subsp. enterica]|uniref:Filamentous hemagglutinin N-terminal domain-containing protein n=5 Tax=Salmonella enterica TaxID=28901 RepID=A0A8E6VG67_SALER|nr:filamentous hemagglutinin N-terminal domain-containing protein [Salmonella enterica]EHY0095880.1 filamentous hemagglutinin N-terminal domain-containing protein [Salmonella enterica]EJO1801693.1 filamentous hemagglutinin N-terminal domain-containing protein [Salmonella enterica]QVR77323.1 filamentous hemagglutinin N-terminal domain-containing protein [Salmonella enterica]QVS15147.1 filamentous hemagglutinin N-terminal domain-containing protein [Salmonella enterica]QVS28005.1 filamentous hema